MSAWYVVHSHPNGEARAVANLTRQGFETYLPVFRKTRSHARRTDSVLRPLFPRYLFVDLDVLRQRWRTVLSTYGVSNLICRGDEPVPVDPAIVQALKDQEQDGVIQPVTPLQRLRLGDKVHVLGGAFVDLIGSFQGMRDADRIVVLLNLLGGEIRATLPAVLVEPA